MTNEILLWRAFINQAIHDSLRKPLQDSDIRPYPEELSRESVKYRTDRTYNRAKRVNEEARVGAQEDIMGDPEFEWIYGECYNEEIDGLREQLCAAWKDIEDDPSRSNYYIKLFNVRRGER